MQPFILNFDVGRLQIVQIKGFASTISPTGDSPSYLEIGYFNSSHSRAANA